MTSKELLQRAVELSFRGMRDNAGGPFGAVIAKNGEIVAQSWNRVLETNDPTAHAEVLAIRSASEKLGRFWLDDCVIYTSCEPCPMCLAAIMWAKIGRVYFAVTTEEAGRFGFDDERFSLEMKRDREARSLKMVRLESADALDAFEEWRGKENKVTY